jgi:hypothetical protein
LDLNDHLWSGRPVTTTHDLNRPKVEKLIQENWWISQKDIAEKLNIGLPSVKEITAGLGYKKCMLDGYHASLHWNEDSRTGSMSKITHLLHKWG